MANKVETMIEEIKSLSVLELSELVHALEDTFGVSAAAVAAPAAGGAAVEAAAEKTEFDVVMTDFGATRSLLSKKSAASPDLALQKQRQWLKAFLQKSRKALPRTTQKLLRHSSKQPAQRLSLSNQLLDNKKEWFIFEPFFFYALDEQSVVMITLNTLCTAGMAELSQSLGFNLTYTLTCDVKFLANFLKCSCSSVN